MLPSSHDNKRTVLVLTSKTAATTVEYTSLLTSETPISGCIGTEGNAVLKWKIQEGKWQGFFPFVLILL